MPTANELTIVNEALVRLGVPPIGSLEDRSAQAIGISAIYENVRDELIADHPWLFAVKEAALSELSLNAADLRYDGWRHVYQLPNDRLRILGLESCAPYVISGDQLYTDEASARVVYVYQAPESLWPPYFVELVAKEMAAALALTLTDSTGRLEIMTGMARQARSRARSLDAQQQPAKIINLMRVYTRRTRNPLTGS